MNTLVRLVALLAVIAMPAQAKEVAGVDMPDTMDAGGTQLVLNGAGVRTKRIVMNVDIYVGGLYLQERSSDAKAIIAADEPMAMKLHMVSKLITSERMEEATTEGFDNATGGNTAPIQQHIDAFMAVFKEKIVPDDVFDIAYVPEQGVVVHKNGKPSGVVDGGLPFKQALFAIWLGDKPAHEGLRDGMLGK